LPKPLRGRYNSSVVPPEIILDRFVRTQLRDEPGFLGYVGKLDVERVEPPSFRLFLHLIQGTMNEALRLENANASGGVPHPTFHFDYLDVGVGIANAHAFQFGDFSFIVVTLPMVEKLWHLSRRLSRSPRVPQLLHLDAGTLSPDALQALLFQIQLGFLVSHEYTHHVHRHCVEDQGGVVGMWTEFPQKAECGSINSQAQELDADGHSARLVLTHLLRGEWRPSALGQLGRADAPSADGDQLLVNCFLLAATAFFCSLWREGVEMASVCRLTHPPPPIRIDYAVRVVKVWCDKNESVPQLWFAPERLQAIFSLAAETVGVDARRTWDAQVSSLRGADGLQYCRQLCERFEARASSGTI